VRGVTVGKAPGRVAVQHRRRLLRETLTSHIAHQPGFTVVGMTALGSEFAQLCSLRQPEIAVVEADAEHWDTAALVAQLRTRNRHLHVVGLYEVIAPDEIVRLYRAGLSKLVDASRGVGAVLAALKAPPTHPGLPPAAPRLRGECLTERELDVLYLISAGCTLQDMSAALSISPRTVENHKRRIFAKLGVHSQAHATASAVRLGLLRPPANRPAATAGAAGQPDPSGPVAAVVPPPRPGAGSDGGATPADATPKALLRGRPGPLFDEVTGLLDAAGVPVLPGDAGDGTPAGPAVAVLVDPAPEDWQVVGDAGTRAVLVPNEAPEQADVAEAVLRGVDAVVPAADVTERLLPAFRAVREGYLMLGAAQGRSLIDAAFTRLSEKRSLWPVELTPRERDILLSIDCGHSVRQTARQLGISARTVENHQSRLFRKLGVRNRAEALAVAHGLGLVDTAKEATEE
jgi:DNA-binding NarL/FixJ family response regulator